jgi:hypothetical protein
MAALRQIRLNWRGCGDDVMDLLRAEREFVDLRLKELAAAGPVDVDHPFVDSFNRGDVVMRNLMRMEPLQWFKQLGEEWSRCDRIGLWSTVLRKVLKEATREELDVMMTDEERATLAALPERFEVWRGCYPANRAGLSWSLDRDVAAGFPMLNRYQREGETPILRRGKVRRELVVLKLDRNESEVVAPHVYSITEMTLEPA